MKNKLMSIFLIIILFFVVSCQTASIQKNSIKDITSNYQKYENKNVKIQAIHKGYVSNYNKLLISGVTNPKYVVFEDKDGYQINALLKIKNKDYVGKEYKISGTIKSLNLCECLVKDYFYTSDINTGTRGSDLRTSNWSKFKNTPYYGTWGSAASDSLPNIDGYSLPDNCNGDKKLYLGYQCTSINGCNIPGTSDFIPGNTWGTNVIWNRSYKCGEKNTNYYYLEVFDLAVVE